MYVILAKIEVIKKVYGPIMTKDHADRIRKELNKKSSMRHVVRKVVEPNANS